MVEYEKVQELLAPIQLVLPLPVIAISLKSYGSPDPPANSSLRSYLALLLLRASIIDSENDGSPSTNIRRKLSGSCSVWTGIAAVRNERVRQSRLVLLNIDLPLFGMAMFQDLWGAQ